jgi:hypothetical protein
MNGITLAEIFLLGAGALIGAGLVFFMAAWLAVLLLDDPNE